MEIRESVRSSETKTQSLERLMKAIRAPSWAEYLFCFALGLILSAAPIAGSPAPFGLAMLAVIGFGICGFLFFTGAAIGYYAGFGFIAGTQMVGGCMLVFVLSCFLRESNLVQSRIYPAQTHVHRVSDAIQPSHPLSSPSSPAPNPSQHQGLFQ